MTPPGSSRRSAAARPCSGSAITSAMPSAAIIVAVSKAMPVSRATAKSWLAPYA